MSDFLRCRGIHQPSDEPIGHDNNNRSHYHYRRLERY
jgi:hypothetical protein